MGLRWTWVSLPVLLSLCVAGCAAPPLVVARVDEPTYLRLPQPVRDGITGKEGQEVTRARDEQRRAALGLLEAERARSSVKREREEAAEATKRARAELRAAEREKDERRREQARIDVRVGEEGERVAEAKERWLRANVSWREAAVDETRLRAATADARLELVKADELARRGAVGFDPNPFRDQHGRLHRRWREQAARVAQLHGAADQALRDLTAAKQRYAEAKKTVLPPPAVGVVPPAGAPAPGASH